MKTKAQYQTKQLAELHAYLETVKGKHVTVNEICEYLKAQGRTVGTTTIYRQLERMVEQGSVAKYTVDGTSGACFEYLGGERELCHKPTCFHCKCEKCGKLIHLHCEEVEHLGEHMQREHGFRLDALRTVFYGLCQECQYEEQNEE
ncbi:MAG: transcriptional repressor [bacterium]|nr:transcriptional repressor [bacterium]